MSYSSLKQLADRVHGSGAPTKTVAVINATESHVLEAVHEAEQDGLVHPILFGDQSVISEQLERMDLNPADFSITHTASAEEAAVEAGKALASGRADFLMKGNIPTATMLRALFSEEAQFRTGNIISHLSIIELPGHPKLFGLTDAAINISPELKQKAGIVSNAVSTMRAMGFTTPKVTALASTEVPNPKMKASMDAMELKHMGAKGEFGDCVVEGPISYDLAMNAESAKVKKYDSPIQGDSDLLVCPDINAANMLIKCLRYAGHSKSAGIVIGGRAPIVLTSRAAATEDKYWPLVLAASATTPAA